MVHLMRAHIKALWAIGPTGVETMAKQHTVSERTLTRLREWFPKGSTVYTIIRHVSSSGMSRTIGVVALSYLPDSERIIALHPNFSVAEVLGLKVDPKREGIKVSGCGMDMAFSIVYDLGVALYGDGYALKKENL
jgi:hypothetical protein